MATITICSEMRSEHTMTSMGRIDFDALGEAKLEAETARALLKKYQGLFWSKKKGKPADVRVDDDELLAVKVEKTPEDNFGFPKNVHVTRAARNAIKNGEMSAEQAFSQREEAVNDTTAPKSDITDDLVRANAAVGTTPALKSLSLNSLKEDFSEDAPTAPRKVKAAALPVKVSKKSEVTGKKTSKR